MKIKRTINFDMSKNFINFYFKKSIIYCARSKVINYRVIIFNTNRSVLLK